MQHILQDLGIEHELNAPLAPHTWYRLGGCAEVLAHPASVGQLSALAAACHAAAVPVRVLGNGANLLVADAGVAGVVVRLDAPAFRQVAIDGHVVTVGAGHDLSRLVLHVARAGLAGLEPLAGIPGSVGGAVAANAGGTYGDIGQVVHSVQLMDAAGETYVRHRDDLRFAYRRTNIAAPFILEVEFELTHDDPAALMKRVKQVFVHKKTTQPLAARSAGCAFKNPDTQPSAHGPSPRDPAAAATAGELIDQANLKGFRIGGAEVSRRHANFVIAHELCTAADVLAVLEHVEETVRARHGVKLERELVVWA